MKYSRNIYISLSVLALLIILAVLQFVFQFTYQDLIYSNFWAFIFSLIAISLFSVVGAIFIGMYVSHHYFSVRNFTPFEEEMLKMRKDVIELKEKIDRLERRFPLYPQETISGEYQPENNTIGRK